MTKTFLHQDRDISPDEILDGDRVDCPTCGEKMWLDGVTAIQSSGKSIKTRDYSCKRCLDRRTVIKEDGVARPLEE